MADDSHVSSVFSVFGKVEIRPLAGKPSPKPPPDHVRPSPATAGSQPSKAQLEAMTAQLEASEAQLNARRVAHRLLVSDYSPAQEQESRQELSKALERASNAQERASKVCQEGGTCSPIGEEKEVHGPDENEKPGCDEKERRPEFEYWVASELNKRSQEIAASIESELRRMLAEHSGTTVKAIQAQVSFRRGSLLLSGAVILVDWAGKIVLEVIGEVIKGAFQRAISNALNDLSAVDFGAMEIAITETKRPPVSPSSTRLSKALRSDIVPAWMPVLLLLLTALVLMLVADRFFVISRTQLSTPPASQTVQPSGTAR